MLSSYHIAVLLMLTLDYLCESEELNYDQRVLVCYYHIIMLVGVISACFSSGNFAVSLVMIVHTCFQYVHLCLIPPFVLSH